MKFNACKITCPIDLKSILLKIPTFNRIYDQTLCDLLDIAHIKTFTKHSFLYYQNDFIDSIDYLIHGCIKIYKINQYDNEIITNLLINGCIKDGDVPKLINYQNLINDKYDSNCECLNSCRIISFHLQYFRELIKTDRALQSNILIEANNTIRHQDYIINLSTYNAQSKLAYLILNNPQVLNMVNKKIIAQLLNISQETLSRNLKKLLDHGYIEFYDNLYLPNTNKLNQLI